MKNMRKLEISIGLFFILATLTFGIGNGMLTSELANNPSSLPLLGMMLESINSISVIAIGWLSFKVLQEHKSMMTGYLISRIIEGIILSAGTFAILMNLENILIFRTYSFLIAMLVLGLYSILYCKFLLDENLLPKWIAITGILGYVSLTLYAIAGMVAGSSDVFMWLFAPGAIFEIVFPIYLIAKGFKVKQA